MDLIAIPVVVSGWVSILKMTTRLSSLLLTVVFFIATLTCAQDPTRKSSGVTRFAEAGAVLQTYIENPTPLPDPGNFLRSSWASDKVIPWKVHLALQLVKHPKLNERQVRFILDAISLSSSELVAVANDAPAKNARAEVVFQALRRRALAAFSEKEATDLFAHTDGSENDILKKYYDVSTLPIKETKASFRNASPTDKSDLWRTHLALFLVKSPELSESQKKVILTAMSLATPEFFEMRSSALAWKPKVQDPLRSLEEQVVSAFTLTDGAKIFATLQDDTKSADCGVTYERPILLRYMNYKTFSDSGIERGPCECSTESDWCPIYGYCNGTNCTPTQSGCGTLWAYPCNGASCKKSSASSGSHGLQLNGQ